MDWVILLNELDQGLVRELLLLLVFFLLFTLLLFATHHSWHHQWIFVLTVAFLSLLNSGCFFFLLGFSIFFLLFSTQVYALSNALGIFNCSLLQIGLLGAIQPNIVWLDSALLDKRRSFLGKELWLRW